jgi:hypothetical protein
MRMISRRIDSNSSTTTHSRGKRIADGFGHGDSRSRLQRKTDSVWTQDPRDGSGVLLWLAAPLPAFTMSRVLVSLWFLLAASLVSSHMIEIMASKKECFFEDLHKHDKVRRKHVSTRFATWTCLPLDDRHLSSRRRRASRHRLLGKLSCARSWHPHVHPSYSWRTQTREYSESRSDNPQGASQ